MVQQPPTAIRRWLDAFVALPARLRLPLAVVLALLVHVVVIAIVWVWPMLLALLLSLSILPEGCAPSSRARVKPEKKNLELTIMTPTPAPKDAKPLTPVEEAKLEQLFAALDPELQRQYIDIEGLAMKKNMSKRALLESWADSVAGTRKQGNGDTPLPSQDGREDLPFTNFKNQQAIVGSPKEDPAIANVPKPEDAAVFKPKPVSKEDPNPVQPEQPVETAAQPKPPTAKPAPTPKPDGIAKSEPPPPSLREVASAAIDEIPLFVKPGDPATPRDQPVVARPTPEPRMDPEPAPPKPTPVPTPVRKPAALPTPAPKSVIVAKKLDSEPIKPVPVANPGYSPHLAMRKIDGGRAPIGESGVDAVATTRGRYVKSLNQAVGSRWTYYVRDPKQASLIAVGSVTLKFSMDSRGKLVRMKIVENTSNASYASLCERAFLEALADFDKPPAELLRDGVFEDTFTFTLY